MRARRTGRNATMERGRWPILLAGGLLIAAVILLQPPAVADAPDFDDVPADHTFAEDIAWLADTGITQGRDDGTFGLNDPVTRGAMAAFLHRYDGEPDGPFDTPDLDDVPDDHTFAEAIAWLADTGITQGRDDGTFGLNDPVTRGAMAAFLSRYDRGIEEDDEVDDEVEDDSTLTGFVGLDMERDEDAGTFSFTLVEDAGEFTNWRELPEPLSEGGTVLAEGLTEDAELLIDGEPVDAQTFAATVTRDDVVTYQPEDPDAGRDTAVIDLIDTRIRPRPAERGFGGDAILAFGLMAEPDSDVTITVSSDEDGVEDLVTEVNMADADPIMDEFRDSIFGRIDQRTFTVDTSEIPGSEFQLTVSRIDEYGTLSKIAEGIVRSSGGP